MLKPFSKSDVWAQRWFGGLEESWELIARTTRFGFIVRQQCFKTRIEPGLVYLGFSPFLNELAAIPSGLTTSLFPHFLWLLSARCVMKVI